MRLEVGRVAALQGEYRPPSDKSLTHRAFMFAASARTPSVVETPLMGEDCMATLHALQAMGLGVGWNEGVAHLVPSPEWNSPASELDCGNSGTTMRLMSGLIASRPIEATLAGDASLSRRPMRRVVEPLRMMGAEITGDHAPLRIQGGVLTGISYTSPVASAQVKSCLLLAGLRAEGETTVTEPELSRDHTERMLVALGVPLVRDPSRPLMVGVRGGSSFDGFRFRVPADISSAAFFLVAAACLPGSRVRAGDVGVNPTRAGLLKVLSQAGAYAHLENERDEGGEPVADIALRGGAPLRAFRVDAPMVPSLIDEIPVLAVLATQCDGLTRIDGAAELRVKESDRLARVAEGLRAMGARVEELPDGLEIEGPTPLSATRVEAGGDHRIAMAFAVAGLLADGLTAIDGAETISTSYPGFAQDLAGLSVY